MLSLRVLCSDVSVVVPCRFASKSTKYIRRPWPRPYRRRMFDLAMAPILPEQLPENRPSLAQRCAASRRARKTSSHRMVRAVDPESEIKQAYAVHVRETLADYRVMAICQELWGDENDKRMQLQRIRPLGIDSRVYPNDVMRTVLRDTRLESLLPLFDEDNVRNLLLLAATPRSLKHIVFTAEKSPYLYLLTCAIDDRLFTRKQCLALVSSGVDLEHLPAITTNILQSGVAETSRLLSSQLDILGRHIQSLLKKRQDEEKKSGDKNNDEKK